MAEYANEAPRQLHNECRRTVCAGLRAWVYSQAARVRKS
jgi:hypothetical protein